MQTPIQTMTTEATLIEKKKLRKEFRLFDMVFYTVAAIVSIDTLGVVSSKGPQVLTWLLISAVTFLFPYGLLTAELGSTFTQEGGVYEWCKLAGGRYFAAFGATLYWISNPLWVGGTLSVTAITAIKTFWFLNPNYSFGGNKVTDAIVEMLIALVFIWGTTWCAITSLRIGKWFSVFGSYVKLALFAFFILLAFVFVVGGHAKGAHFTVADLVPTNWGLIVSGILPVLIFNWVGFELQSGAGEEMHHPQRDVPVSLLRSGSIAVLAYSIPIAVLLFALPKEQLTNAGSFLQAFQTVSSVLPAPIVVGLGILVALGAIIALASSGSTWVIGTDRTYAIAALDRAAPVFLGRFSDRYGTPVAVNVLTGLVATIAMAAVISVNAFSSDPNVTQLFGLVLGFTISTTTLSYLFIFPAYIILRYKYPTVPRPYKVPGGMVVAWIVTLLPLAYAAVASYFILIPTDSTIGSFTGITRLTYELTQFIPLVAIFLLTTIFYIWGHREKQNRDKEDALPLQQEEVIENSF